MYLYVSSTGVHYGFVNVGLGSNVEIYHRFLPGMNVPRRKYILLIKALSCLKEVARQWNIDINTYILSSGVIRLWADSYVYVRGSNMCMTSV